MRYTELKARFNELKAIGLDSVTAVTRITKEQTGYGFGPLTKMLNFSNAKTPKGEKKGYLTGVLYLSSANSVAENYTVCANAEQAGCKTGCLVTAGRGRYAKVQAARYRKTLLYMFDRAKFYSILESDIQSASRKAAKMGYKLAIRLNGTSDIAWENTHLPTFIKKQGGILYDYTKIPERLAKVKKGYNLVLSYSEHNTVYALKIQRAMQEYPKANVAVVFNGPLPATYLGRKVIDGDETDLRFLDPKGVVVGLKAKGRAKQDKGGFVIHV